MKRSLGTAELPVLRPLVPDTADDPAPAVEPAAEEPAPVQSAELNAADQAPMAFPGPFAYVPKPATMEDGDTKPGSASSASSGREGSGEAVVSSGSLAAVHSQPHIEPAPATGGSSTSAAGAVITHATAAGDNPHGFSPLILAAYKGRLAEVKLLLEDPDVDIDQVDQKFGGTALTAATCTNKPEVVALLLANGAKVNFACGRRRLTALMEASLRGHVAVVKALLICKDIALDAIDANGISALYPNASVASTAISLRVSSVLTTATCPRKAASINTVRRCRPDTRLTLAPLARSNATTSGLLVHDAAINAVPPDF